MKKLTQNKFLNEFEIKHLKETLNRYKHDRDSILIRVALYTGARSCEILGIKKRDVKDSCITIYGRKNSNDRTIPIPNDLFRDLVIYAHDVDSEYLFPISTRHFRRIWDQYRPNQNLGLHSLRHTFGIQLYKNCHDIYIVKSALGHRQIANTHIYLDFVQNIENLKTSILGMWSKI